jgi:hypothetical protein
MAFEWTPQRRKLFKRLVEQGNTDAEVTEFMFAKCGGVWTVHMVRSQRGRMERAGEIKRGLSGSSKKPVKKPAKKSGKMEINRRVLGINVMHGTGKSGVPPCAYLIYGVDWSDGSYTTEQGHTVRTLPGFEHLNGTKQEKAWAKKNLRPDLYEIIIALGVLVAPIEKACLNLDDARRNKR